MHKTSLSRVFEARAPNCIILRQFDCMHARFQKLQFNASSVDPTRVRCEFDASSMRVRCSDTTICCQKQVMFCPHPKSGKISRAVFVIGETMGAPLTAFRAGGALPNPTRAGQTGRQWLFLYIAVACRWAVKEEAAAVALFFSRAAELVLVPPWDEQRQMRCLV